MATGSAHPVLRFIRRIRIGADDASDAGLLARFLNEKDDTAFAALVRRHGPMVLGVCSRVLGDAVEAEDAFQATFLVLVRRAASIGKPELLANWLYGVAQRTALKARAGLLRRRRRERTVIDMLTREPEADVVWRDLRPILDEEVGRLPQRYRVPFVLCHLEGQTHEEIARRLGCPRETVTTRLSRARERLRGQLTRRGVALSTGLLAALLTERALAAEVSSALFDTTIKAATLFAAGQTAAGVVSLQAASLARGVLRAMFLSKLKVAVALLLGLGIVAWSATRFAGPSLAAGSPTEIIAAETEAPLHPENANEADDEVVSVKALPPVVVKTVPASGDTKVDAKAITEIRVTFSKDMKDKSWSWSSVSKETYAEPSGEITYDKDKRTCIFPVKLEPGRTYAFWINSEKYQNFRDAEERAAVPYLLVFETVK